MAKHFYRLQLCRTEMTHDQLDESGKAMIPVVVDRGEYLQANGHDVEFLGYASAINRAGELNSELRQRNQSHFRWVPVESGYEKQQSL